MPNLDSLHPLAITLLILCFLGLSFNLVIKSPSEISSKWAGLISVFPDPSHRNRYSISNAVPEVDAVTLGAAILTRLDPFMRRSHARRIRHTLREMYAELEAEEGTRQLATVADMAIAELVGSPFRNRLHFYAYIPEHESGESLGMLVFLHGNAGNHKIMAWSWKEFAERNRVAIVCPTFGFGFWGEGGVEAANRIYQYVIKSMNIDVSRVWLAGISDGGKGVTRFATAHPGHFTGLIYLSPTLTISEFTDSRFLDSWKARPVLAFHGDSDHNVLKRDVDRAVDAMRAGGIDVIYKSFPNEDHFLFFARRNEIFEALAPYFR